MPRSNLRLVWSPTALHELVGIWDYLVEHASDAVAAAQIHKISTRCELLKEHPFSGRPRDDLRPGLRAVLVSPYVVLYRVSVDSVQVMHVVHGRRDIPALLAGDD